jgi:hypothetical protein
MSQVERDTQPPTAPQPGVRQSTIELLKKMERVGMSPAEWHAVVTTTTVGATLDPRHGAH